MPSRVHMPSLAYGVVATAILACVIGAAQTDTPGLRFDAASVMGGLGLQIVDHETDRLYNYRRDKGDDQVTYHLAETVDLSLAGQTEIPAKVVDE